MIDKGTLDLSQIKIVILDEADEMLRRGFQDSVESILQHCEKAENRQTLLFSATIPDWIQQVITLTLQRLKKNFMMSFYA